MPVSIYILTTQGPVRIQRIAAEPSGVQSVICLDGRAQALPISSLYDAFVRNPTGVVERATGHDAYRVDVDGVVDDGESWQLSLYLAHIIANIDVTQDVHIFATGEVDRDLNVRPVGHLAEKLEHADELLTRLRDQGAIVHLFVPSDGSVAGQHYQDVNVTPVSHIEQALEALNIPQPSIVSSDHPSKVRPQRGLIITAAAIALFLGWLFWMPMNWIGLSNEGELLELEEAISEAEKSVVGRFQSNVFSNIQEWRRPDIKAASLTGYLTLSSHPDQCGDTEVIRKVAWDSDFDATEIICAIEVRGEEAAPGILIVGRLAYWPDGLAIGGKPHRTMRGSARPTGRTWELKFESVPTQESIIRVVTLVGRALPKGSQPWFAPLLSEPQESEAFMDAKARIIRLGYGVSVHDWKRPTSR